MSPLRLPQHLGEPTHTDTGEAVLRFELLEEIDAGLARCERQVQATVAELAACPPDGDPTRRAELVDTAAEAVWRLIVQHEACDICNHQPLVERYHIPAEVMARLGASH